MHYLRDRGFVHPVASEITPRATYLSRRHLMQAAAAGLAGAAWPVWAQTAQTALPGKLAPLPATRSTAAGAVTMDKTTPYPAVTSYNNFYEFGTDKSDPAAHAHTLKTRPWTVTIEGEVKKPGIWDLDALLKLASGSNYFYLAENGSIRMVVANGGNVGIGTTAPAARLDVAGTANISSDLTVFGDIVVNGNKGIVRSTNGTQIKYYSQQAAFFNVGLAAFGTSAEANIAWPAGMFSSPPKVLVGDITSTGGSTGQLWRMQLVTYDVTTTGCHCVIINTWNGAVNYSVTWNIVCIGN